MNHSAKRWGANRFACAIAALMVNALIGYALLIGLRNAPLLRVLPDNSLVLINLRPPAQEQPEATPQVKPRPVARKTAGSPSPPRVREKPDRFPPAPVIMPAPVIALPQPTLPAAPSPVTGNGTGGGVSGGGWGNGGGSGGGGGSSGPGTGDGGEFSPARQTRGSFRNSDFPASARGAGRLKIGVRYAVGPSGRVDQCEIIESSGYAEVDAMTCRVIVERYRFRPARDPDGYAVTEVREEDYRWRQGRMNSSN